MGSLSSILISLSFFAELAMPCGKMNLPQRVNKQVPRGEETHEIITVYIGYNARGGTTKKLAL